MYYVRKTTITLHNIYLVLSLSSTSLQSVKTLINVSIDLILVILSSCMI